jgi:hypothetical protein
VAFRPPTTVLFPRMSIVIVTLTFDGLAAFSA